MNFKINETAEKLRGGYYTDAVVTDYIVRWTSRARPAAVLEPSCGDGAFLRALVGGNPASGLTTVLACEIDPIEANKSAKVLKAAEDIQGRVQVGDFLAWVMPRINSAPEFDAVVGNPPFIRYQYLDRDVQERAELLIRHFGLRFTKHTNAWVPFVIGALNRLRPGGRLGMVIPSELLHVLHAESVRTYLLRECSRILVLDPEELWFEDSLQGVVLLLAEKKPALPARRELARIAIARIDGRRFLAGDPEAHFNDARYIDGSVLTSKWTFGLLSERERGIIKDAEQAKGVRRFADIADVQVGIVTGANHFFLVTDEVVATFDLARYAHPMFGRSDHVDGVIYSSASHAANRRRGMPTNFIWFQDQSVALKGGPAQYIAMGESKGLHKRFKCRIREPWYSVPSVFATDVGMLKRSHDYPRLVLNSAGAFTTDTAYRIRSRMVDSRCLVFSFVNSFTALSAELEGRHYGGGVLELVPSEINRLLLPLTKPAKVDLTGLDRAYRRGDDPLAILQTQDEVLLSAAGLAKDDILAIQSAWLRLRNRRQRSGAVEDHCAIAAG